jgi:hypothetical protein
MYFKTWKKITANQEYYTHQSYNLISMEK